MTRNILIRRRDELLELLSDFLSCAVGGYSKSVYRRLDVPFSRSRDFGIERRGGKMGEAKLI